MDVAVSVEQYDRDDIEVRIEWTRSADAKEASGMDVRATWPARRIEDALRIPTRFEVKGKPTIKVAATGRTVWWKALTDAERVAILEAAEDIVERFAWESWWWTEVAYAHVWRFPA